MPNEQNLIPNSERSPEALREMAANGGRASGVSRRRKRSLREAADLYLSLPVASRKRWNAIAKEGVDPEDIDNQMAMIIGLTQAAMGGDARAAKVIVDLIGPEQKEDDAMTKLDNLLAEFRKAVESEGINDW